MIADDRRRSQRELFPYNRRQSQTIAEPTVAYISVSGSVRKIAANNMADVEEETLLQANLFLLLVQSFPAVSLFVFVFEVFTVTVVNALISCNFLHKFLVTNVTLFNASHVYKKIGGCYKRILGLCC